MRFYRIIFPTQLLFFFFIFFGMENILSTEFLAINRPYRAFGYKIVVNFCRLPKKKEKFLLESKISTTMNTKLLLILSESNQSLYWIWNFFFFKCRKYSNFSPSIIIIEVKIQFSLNSFLFFPFKVSLHLLINLLHNPSRIYGNDYGNVNYPFLLLFSPLFFLALFRIFEQEISFMIPHTESLRNQRKIIFFMNIKKELLLFLSKKRKYEKKYSVTKNLKKKKNNSERAKGLCDMPFLFPLLRFILPLVREEGSCCCYLRKGKEEKEK